MRRRLMMAMEMEEDKNMSWQYLGESTMATPLQFESGKYKEYIITGYVNVTVGATQYARINIDGHTAVHYAICNTNGEVALTLFVPLLVAGAPTFYAYKNGKQSIGAEDRGNASTAVLGKKDSSASGRVSAFATSGGKMLEYKLQVWAR